MAFHRYAPTYVLSFWTWIFAYRDNMNIVDYLVQSWSTETNKEKSNEKKIYVGKYELKIISNLAPMILLQKFKVF